MSPNVDHDPSQPLFTHHQSSIKMVKVVVAGAAGMCASSTIYSRFAEHPSFLPFRLLFPLIYQSLSSFHRCRPSTKIRTAHRLLEPPRSGGIGQPLSLLLKLNPLVTELSLYDVVNAVGVSALHLADLSLPSEPIFVYRSLPISRTSPPPLKSPVSSPTLDPVDPSLKTSRDRVPSTP